MGGGLTRRRGNSTTLLQTQKGRRKGEEGNDTAGDETITFDSTQLYLGICNM